MHDDRTYTAIPPVRRNGPQESQKENLEAAELEYMLSSLEDIVSASEASEQDVVTAMSESLSITIDSLSTMSNAESALTTK
jgi:hypothetical protein